MSAIKAKRYLEVDGQKVFIQQDLSSTIKEKRISTNLAIFLQYDSWPCSASHTRKRNIYFTRSASFFEWFAWSL